MSTNRRYSELIKLPTLIERFEYLRLNGEVGFATFGYDRWLNQIFYRDKQWKSVRNDIIIRDNGCNLGLEGYEIRSGLIVHHINPITKEDILNRSPKLFNPENLICVSDKVHRAIHYGDRSLLPQDPITRTPNDTCPWRH